MSIEKVVPENVNELVRVLTGDLAEVVNGSGGKGYWTEQTAWTVANLAREVARSEIARSAGGGEMLAAAQGAIDRMKSRPVETDEQWAARLAPDLVAGGIDHDREFTPAQPAPAAEGGATGTAWEPHWPRPSAQEIEAALLSSCHAADMVRANPPAFSGYTLPLSIFYANAPDALRLAAARIRELEGEHTLYNDRIRQLSEENEAVIGSYRAAESSLAALRDRVKKSAELTRNLLGLTDTRPSQYDYVKVFETTEALLALLSDPAPATRAENAQVDDLPANST